MPECYGYLTFSKQRIYHITTLVKHLTKHALKITKGRLIFHFMTICHKLFNNNKKDSILFWIVQLP